MNFRFFFLVICSLGGSICFKGCAPLNRHESAPKLMETAGLFSTMDKAVRSSTFCSGQWPSNQWWTLFGDPQLNAIMEVAIRENPNLMVAAARARASFEIAKRERGSLSPKLGGTLEVLDRHLSRNELPALLSSKIPRAFSQMHLDLNFNYEIDFFGKNRNAYRAALGVAKAEVAEMSQSFLIVTTSLASAYIEYAAFFKTFEISQKIVQARKDCLKLIEERWKRGIGDDLGVNLAKILLIEGEKRALECEKEVQIARNQIKVLMGVCLDDPNEIQPPTLSFESSFPLPDELPLNLLARRPDLMAQIWKVEAAASLTHVAKSAFFPNVNLKALAGLHSLNWRDLVSFRSVSSLIYPAIHLPLFAGGALTATLNEAFAKYEQSVWEYNALVLQAAKEVADQIQRVETLTQEAKMSAQARLNAQNASAVTCVRYEKGVDPYLSVLSQEIAVMEQMIEEVEIEAKRRIALLFLIKALGGGYERR